MRIESMRLVDVGPFDDTTIEFPKGTNPELADVYLLVGENGTGKSTVLYALAEIIAGGNPSLSTARISKRFRTKDSFVYCVSDVEKIVVAPLQRNGLLEEWQRSPIRSVDHPIALDNPSVRYFSSRGQNTFEITPPHKSFDRFFQKAVHTESKYSWVALGYGARLSEHEVHVKDITEDLGSPFGRILSFTDTANPQVLAQFVASQMFKSLKAERAKNIALAKGIEDAIDRIAVAIEEIIEDKFEFVARIDSLDILFGIGKATVPFSVLPDGVKSVIGFIGDLLMRLERIQWDDNTPILQRNFLLLLDEIDIHLHPRWQRKILSVIQKLFPNAQIIASTHSPFVVASLKDGAVIELKRNEKGGITAVNRSPEELKLSYSATVAEVFGIESDFPIEVEEKYKTFKSLRDSFAKTGDKESFAKLEEMAKSLAEHGEEMSIRIGHEMRQLRK